MGLLKWLTSRKDNEENGDLSALTTAEELEATAKADGREDAKRDAQRLAASGLEPSETLMNAMMLRSLAKTLSQRFPELTEVEIAACVERAKSRHNL